MRFALLFLISLLSFHCEVFSQKKDFKVMAWNILRSGNQIENGVDIVSDIIKEINPDVVLMVETYGSGPYICLLYTSPSPRDLSTSRMPSSA